MRQTVKNLKDASRNCLVTGFPSIIVRRLVYEILAREKSSHVTMLVRDKFITQARRNANEYLTADMQKRLNIITGDIVNMHLGLSSNEYNKLIEDVTDIYHLAAITYLGIDEATMRNVNVHGTANMIEFASDCRKLNRFNYYSTCFVSGNRIGVILESELDFGQKFRNGFEKTKYEGELLVERWKSRLPISIYRPSILIGDSRTGEIDRFTEPYYIAIAMVGSPLTNPLPLVGNGVAPLNIVPTDYIVRAMHRISRSLNSAGKTFHLVDPNPHSVKKVYEIIAARLGKKMPPYHIPASLARVALQLPGLDRYFPSPLRAVDYIDHLAIYNSANTMAELDGTGVSCPHFEDYADKLIQFVRTYFEKRLSADGENLKDQLA